MSVSDTTPDTTTTQWFQDWPLVERTPLSKDERTAISRERVRLQTFGCLLTPIFPIVFLVGLAMLAGGDLTGRSGILMGVSLLAFLLLSVAPLAIANTCFKRAKAAKQDLQAGQRRRFAGVITHAMTTNDVIFKLVANGHLSMQDSTQSVDILASGHLWRANDRPVRGWSFVTISETTAVPEIAHIAANWLDPVAETPDGPINAGKRELTNDEKEELRQQARRKWQSTLLPAILSTAWCTPLLIYGIRQQQFPRGFFFLLLVAATVLADIALVKGIRTAIRIRRDAAVGLALIMQGPIGPRSRSQAPNDGNEHTIELLPAAKLVWTVDGEPADWRKRVVKEQR